MSRQKYYGTVIDDYVKSNRDYPKELFDDMIKYSKIQTESQLLEIGAGPGTATDELLDYPIDVLEITEAQVSYLKDKYKEQKDIRIYCEKFETFETETKYDLIYAGTTFHWVDPRIGYQKAAGLLRTGGTLGLFWNLTYGVQGKGLYRELLNIERKYGLALTDRSNDYLSKMKSEVMACIDSTGEFEQLTSREYYFDRVYNAENYLAWIRSRWFKFGELCAEKQVSFEREIRSLFEENGSEISIEQTILLVLAKKAANLRGVTNTKEHIEIKPEQKDIKVGITNCLKSIKGDSFDQSEDLITGGYIDSFELMFLIEELEKYFHVKIPLAFIEPERFNRVNSICELLEECMQ